MGTNERDWMNDGEAKPPEFSASTFKDSAVILHEMYASYVSAGFTPEQAMAILLTQMQKY